MAAEKRLIYLEDAYEAVTDLSGQAETKSAYAAFWKAGKEIQKLPTVDAVEVVHGRWREKILVGGFAEEWGYVCSECGCTVSDRSNLGIGRYASKNQRLNYCPNCGAYMMDGDWNG